MQTELLGQLFSQGNLPVSISFGGGYVRDYAGTSAATARIVMGKMFRQWDVVANLFLEKPFAGNRDRVDIVTTLGTSWQMSRMFRAGFEWIAEDLEGLWEADEAEGGAKMLIGPTIHLNGFKRLFLTAGGGPVLYLTRSNAISPAIRKLPDGNGFIVGFHLSYQM